MSSATTSTRSGLPLHAGKTLLDVDNVSVLLGGERVLDDISFCIHPGEFIGLIGPNGAGKTTLLRTILGLQPATSGRIKRPRGVTVGYVPQRGAVQHGQVPMSVGEIVGLGGRQAGVVRQALEDVGLAGAAGRRYRELSGGQQQRALIAQALASQPALLILDEPTTGIDEAAQRDFFAILERLAERGITIVMVSHDLEAVMVRVGRVICLNRRLLYDGPPQSFEVDEFLPQMYAARHRTLHHRHGGRPEGHDA